jgi:hypothetical protein
MKPVFVFLLTVLALPAGGWAQRPHGHTFKSFVDQVKRREAAESARYLLQGSAAAEAGAFAGTWRMAGRSNGGRMEVRTEGSSPAHSFPFEGIPPRFVGPFALFDYPMPGERRADWVCLGQGPERLICWDRVTGADGRGPGPSVREYWKLPAAAPKPR